MVTLEGCSPLGFHGKSVFQSEWTELDLRATGLIVAYPMSLWSRKGHRHSLAKSSRALASL